MKGVAIIDFDNWFKKNLSDYTDTQFELELRGLVDQLLELVPELDEIELRMYNGWYQERVLTRKASELQLLLSRITLFPYELDPSKARIVRGKIEIVSSLNDLPSYVWFNTVKEKKGIPSLRIDRTSLTSTCDARLDTCPVHIMKRFTKKKNKECSIESCSVLHSDVFIGLEQKMVDTMIACDIISFCEDDDCEAILVVSEDIDHFPAIAKGKLKLQETDKDKELSVLIKNNMIQSNYDAILASFGLKTILVV
jgi:hypothetical protein